MQSRQANEASTMSNPIQSRPLPLHCFKNGQLSRAAADHINSRFYGMGFVLRDLDTYVWCHPSGVSAAIIGQHLCKKIGGF